MRSSNGSDYLEMQRGRSEAPHHWLNNSEPTDGCTFGVLIGRSPSILRVFEQIRRLAPHFRTVLVTGPTGSGKELVAKSLHDFGGTKRGPFVACNCAAIVETLFESELFGHIKGAFTGALCDKAGFFEHAHGGTLLLDEIGDMTLATQAKLLRVLQDQQVQRVGSPVARKVDVRFIAVTNRDLRRMIELKQFREDLYYRLSVVEINLPPLAQRREDIPILAKHFLSNHAAKYRLPMLHLSKQAQDVLVRHTWPGNVRELENVVNSSCMLAESDTVTVSCLPRYLQDHECEAPCEAHVFQCKELVSLAELEHRYAEMILRTVDYNKTKTAQVLSISRPRLYKLLARQAK
jgi:two-component system response regulator HydG